MIIQFPEYTFRLKKHGEHSLIFDRIRKKFVALTPEEWVRQHWVHYLIEEKKYPRSLLAIEMHLTVNRLKKRCDIVVYGKDGLPQLIVECKSTNVKITQNVFDQIARYNLTLRVKYLVVSNGNETFCCEINHEKGSYKFLPELPDL
ncbi:MAG: type I restriction enzyme HsdR N-terminal domain-containing protein [Chitinophagales bacterium]|nr:type I restriction enzyme HsdR N-terminal domain-containing protein [Chitinophagales bacterium]